MSTKFLRASVVLFIVTASLVLFISSSLGIQAAPLAARLSVSLASLGTPYTQNFDTLANSGTPSWTDDSTLTGWYVQFTTTPTPTTYIVSTGTSTTGAIYSYGSAASTERALGSIGANSIAASGSPCTYIALKLTNDTGNAIASFVITYTGEQWRNGGVTNTQKLDFQYQVANSGIITDANSPSTGWTDFNSLDFTSPITGSTAGALDGNAAANRTTKTAILTVTVSTGQEIWLRWMDTNDAGSDHGLAIDDFSVTPYGTVVDSAPSVASTSPISGATNVAVTSDIVITFSEAVTTTGSWYTINGSSSGSHTASVSGGPTNFTLNPDSDFAISETVTVTVVAVQVTDQDGMPDNMASNYVFIFTTESSPSVIATNPINGATNVSLSSNVVITFSEAVNVASGWYTITGSTSGAHAASVTGGATTFTLDPSTNFDYAETVTVTVGAAQVTDQDSNDPPDNMSADYTWTFTTPASLCSASFTPIYAIQGNGLYASLTYSGTSVTTQGIVVGDNEGPSPALRGFYLQDQTGDADVTTSDGIFVFNSGVDNVSIGQVVRVTGTAVEFQDQTQISSPTIVDCGTTDMITPTSVTMPLAAPSGGVPYLERVEGMLVTFPQDLYVTEHFQLERFGQIVVSSGDRLYQPTNVITPGAPALALQASNDLNRLIIDDENNNQDPDPIKFGRGGNTLTASNTLRGGDTVSNAIGVMTYGWAGNAASPNDYRLRPINALNGGAPNFQPTNPRPANPGALGGTLKVQSANLLNYFNTFGVGNCTGGVGGAAMDCRGAENTTEFTRQYSKTIQNLVLGGADIIGIMEMENDGYGTSSAIYQLVDRLNAITASGTYTYVNVDAKTGQTNALGTDAIKVGLIYKPATVTPVGNTAVLNTAAFVTGGDGADRNRPALAQSFQQISTGQRLTVIPNHLKSKGSACNTPDANDGQGNCNVVRTNAAQVLITWLQTYPTGVIDPDFMILGDLNSYAREDPITAIKNGGFTNLSESLIGSSAYSYVFDGQWGYLDYQLSSASLTPQVSGIEEWHINADEPSALDYNTDFKSVPTQTVGLYNADQFRTSDHDPILVGLNLVAHSCYATRGNGTIVYGSADASAVQSAVDAATNGDTIKIAGTCAGVNTRGGSNQTIYISKTLSVQGGYTLTNWTTSNPGTQPTTLDAQNSGRVINLNGVAGDVSNLTVQNGNISGNGGGIYASDVLTLTNVSINNNTASSAGDGLYANNHLTLTQVVTTTDNWAILRDFTDNGTFTQLGGAVIFQGAVAQTIKGSRPTTFADLAISNTGAGVTLGQDITVTTRLTLTSDLTTTASYTLNLTLNATSSGTGDVWGRTYRKHTFSADTTYSFGNPNVSLTFGPTSTVPSAALIDLQHGRLSGFTFAISRAYTITVTGSGPFSATLRLHYQDSELGNGETNVQLWRFNGSIWTLQGKTSADTAANWVEQNGISAFSPWGLSNQTPTAITIESFSAQSESFHLALLLIIGVIGSAIVFAAWRMRRA
jgi:hypothetical protein